MKREGFGGMNRMLSAYVIATVFPRTFEKFRRGLMTTQTQQGEYNDVQYWNRRYNEEAEDTFDWYQRYEDLEPLLKKYVPKTSRILMPGCGNAVLSEKMVRDGYKEIVNVDFSSVVIKAMQNKYRHIPQLTYMTMDARDMSVFGDNSFDAVIDKGLLDSFLCGANGILEVSIVLEEIRRVLKPGGKFMLITYGEPPLRIHYLKDPAFEWDVIFHHTGGPKIVGRSAWYTDAIPLDEKTQKAFKFTNPELNFVYVCTK